MAKSYPVRETWKKRKRKPRPTQFYVGPVRLWVTPWFSDDWPHPVGPWTEVGPPQTGKSHIAAQTVWPEPGGFWEKLGHAAGMDLVSDD